MFIEYIVLVGGVSVYSPNPTYSNHTRVVESSPIVVVVVMFIEYIVMVVGVSVYSPNPTYCNHIPLVESSPIVVVGECGYVYKIHCAGGGGVCLLSQPNLL
jgi:hypothetical protein